ncbi:hypothetical protein AGMMS49941_07630 [Deferribacterales bacterium]|nr:hypothetical protein AGMMS49941_07630 [Deferribacterales bacterium]
MRPDRNLFLTTPTEILVRTEMTDDIYEIANKFRKLTSKNDRLLLDPYHKRRGMFSIISQRDVYLIGEEGPETYFGLYEKEKRVRKLGCVYEGDFAKKTPAEIVALLDEIAYKYVLVDNASEQFKSFSGLTPVIEQGTWTIFMRK